jgi:hypothetical protein
LWVLILALAVAAGALIALNGQSIRAVISGLTTTGLDLAVSFSTVGAVVAARRPRNPLGWIFLAVGLSQSLDSFDTEYARYALVTRPGSLPGGAAMGWLALWTWAPGGSLIATLSLLLFPTGRPPSPRWRWVVVLVPVAIVLMVVPVALLPVWYADAVPADTLPGDNVPAAHGAFILQLVGLGLVAVCMLASAASVIVRFRRARGVERQQLKWLAYAGVFTAVGLAVEAFLGEQTGGPLAATFALAMLVAVIPSIPAAVAVAMLRHRLYDIDRLINRTLVYALLTAILGLVYLAGVLVVGQVLNPAGGDSPLVIAASTLAVAALFQPVRRRVQASVDRRFNRRRFDATRTIEAFSARLRDHIELDTLSTELLAVVDQTMEPTRASLWLRP